MEPFQRNPGGGAPSSLERHHLSPQPPHPAQQGEVEQSLLAIARVRACLRLTRTSPSAISVTSPSAAGRGRAEPTAIARVRACLQLTRTSPSAISVTSPSTAGRSRAEPFGDCSSEGLPPAHSHVTICHSSYLSQRSRERSSRAYSDCSGEGLPPALSNATPTSPPTPGSSSLI